MGKQKREFPLCEQPAELFGAEVMRLCVPEKAEEGYLHPKHRAQRCGHLYWGEGNTRVCDVQQQHKKQANIRLLVDFWEVFDEY